MITVKLFGLLRLDSGIREKQLEAKTVKDVLTALEHCGIPKKDLDSCIVLVEGKNAGKRTKLQDGDTVVLMSPVAGG